MNACSANRSSRMRLVARLLLSLTALLCAHGAKARLLFYEGFDYPAGEELGAFASRPTWDNDKREFTIVDGSLVYPGLRASTGNRVNAKPTTPSLDSVRTLDNSWTKQSSGTLYISLLVRLTSVTEIGATGEGTSLVTLSDTMNNTPLLGINLINDGATRVGVVKYPSSSDTASASAFFSAGPGANLSADGSTTVLIVAKYEWVEGPSNDVVTAWINPNRLGAGEETVNRVSTSKGPDGVRSAGRLTLSRGPSVEIDELRIGQTWAEVTPTPGPPYRWLAAVGALAVGLVVAGLWIARLTRKVEERSIALKAQIKERQEVEQQRLMDQERARIAQDLHDELGADITEISMLATRAQGDAGGADGRRCLEQMADKSRQMVAKLDEIVWAMNPEHDSLGALVSYFSFFADRFLGLANINLILHATEDAAGLAVEARIRHQLFLVFREALANVVQHSGARGVKLTVRVENRALQVELADNGCGMREPRSTGAGHEGIANMRRRMEKLGGSFEIAGESGRGTTVRFSVPLNS